jgi:hypothetical protein
LLRHRAGKPGGREKANAHRFVIRKTGFKRDRQIFAEPIPELIPAINIKCAEVTPRKKVPFWAVIPTKVAGL